jgi:hypothetical protein
MIAFLLLYKIEWTDKHPVLMLACAAAVAVGGAVLARWMA